MSASRTQHVSDNLELVARTLIDNILQADKQVILDILNTVKDEYEGTGYHFYPLAMLESTVHMYSRQRGMEISDAISIIKETDENNRLNFLNVIAGLLNNGNTVSTSANTKLLSCLISRLSTFVPIEEDARLSQSGAKTTIRALLRDNIVQQAISVIQEYVKQMESYNDILKTEKPKVSRIDDNESFKQARNNLATLFEKKQSKKKDITVGKLGDKYSGIQNELTAIHKKKRKKKKKVVADSDRSSNFADARKQIGAMFAQRQSDPHHCGEVKANKPRYS